MNDLRDDVLEVGDMLRFSVELVDALQRLPHEFTVLVRVKQIERQADRTVKLWLENADATPPVLQ